ncbi:MAG TPA: glycosyltransferase family 4 protein [Mycobacteriales bacterium]
MALEVAYLTNQLPWPPISGGQVREWELLRRVVPRCAVHLFAVGEYADRDRGVVGRLPLDVRSVHLAGATAPAPDGPVSTYRERVHHSRGFASVVAAVLEQHPVDVVHVEGYFLMQHVPPTAVPVLVMTENVEYLIEVQLGHVAEAALAAERCALDRATVVGAVSDADARELRRLLPGKDVVVVPNGVDHLGGPHPPAGPHAGPLLVAYIANYTWPPSADGAAHLLDTLWPEIRGRTGKATLLLVGPGMDPHLAERVHRTPGVEATGYVRDLDRLYADVDLLVCASRFGGGTKVKVLEALAAGRPLVALAPCAEGLPASALDGIRVCGTDAEFVESAVALLSCPAERAALAHRAVLAARSLPRWDDVATELVSLWRDLARRGTA